MNDTKEEKQDTNHEIEMRSISSMSSSMPCVDELVVFQVQELSEIGMFVKLLEYTDPFLSALIAFPEIGRRRKLRTRYQVGMIGVARVTRMDPERGYVDLVTSRCREEIEAKMAQFRQNVRGFF